MIPNTEVSDWRGSILCAVNIESRPLSTSGLESGLGLQYNIFSVPPRNNLRHVKYVHHKLLAASVLGTSMICTIVSCTKHRFSIIYECMHVFPTNSIKFYKRRHVGPTCLKIPGENTDIVYYVGHACSSNTCWGEPKRAPH